MNKKLKWIEVWLYLMPDSIKRRARLYDMDFFVLKGYEDGTIITYNYDKGRDIDICDNYEDVEAWLSEDEFRMVERKYVKAE